ncbi:dUTPase domain-containing protein [Nephila pilipes]|uniref:Deoxyuridine 5'-triphosphate nucleotidohydrolase n=1 Tax=Nephila pilipes TaxID=299642 RepID=A0A8X6NRD2_NEPPI|nr:dUTPase domain-containing protein [Nephila pilipes]
MTEPNINGFVAPVQLTTVPIQLELGYQLIRPEAYKPTVHDDGSSGVDLYSPKPYTLDPFQQIKVFTGVVFEFQAGWTAFLKDKSSVVTRKQLTVEGGVIDPGYRGEIIVVLRNMSQNTVFIRPGDAVAQLVNVYTGLPPVLKPVYRIESNTRRGTRGFGGDHGQENANK